MKLGEYLASGRPILVHAPKDTFIAQYFRQHRAGIVVDRPDTHVLADALRDLASNALLRHTLRGNALRLAEHYRLRDVRENFWEVVRSAFQ